MNHLDIFRGILLAELFIHDAALTNENSIVGVKFLPFSRLRARPMSFLDGHVRSGLRSSLDMTAHWCRPL